MSQTKFSTRMYKATAVMASGTMISRILGFLRVGLIAFILGNGSINADILSISSIVPGTLYMLLAGGTLNTVLVPQIVRAVENDPDGGEAFINRMLTFFLAIILGFTVLFTILTPWVLRIFTAPDWRTPERAPDWSALITMTYITMPQLFFFGASFLLGQILNAKQKFGPIMWSPIIGNVTSIVVLSSYLALWGATGTNRFTLPQQILLATGTTVGLGLQTLCLTHFTKHLGFRLRPRWDFKGSGIRHILNVAKWAAGYALVSEIAVLIGQYCTSSATASVPPGHVAAGATVMNNAYLVFILPHSLLTVSIATAMVPVASNFANRGDLVGVTKEATRTIRLALTFAVPVTLGFILFAYDFCRIAFGNGAGARDSNLIAQTLIIYGIGMVPFTIFFISIRTFYVLEETRTSFFIQSSTAVLQIILMISLILTIDQPETVAQRIALAAVITTVVNSILGLYWLKKKLVVLNLNEIFQLLARLFLAVTPGAFIAWLVTQIIPTGGLFLHIVRFIVGGSLLVLVFGLTAIRLRVPEVKEFTTFVLKKPQQAPKIDEDTIAELNSMNTVAIEDMTTSAAGTTTTIEATALIPGEITESLGPSYYPEINEPIPDEVFPNPDSIMFRSGQVLDGRYQIDTIIASYREVTSWRAFDQVLGRAVLIHALRPDDPQTRERVEEARRAAIATDARFLRVLDVVEGEAETGCAYIVGEYSPGYTLTRVIQTGAITPVIAAWIGHEVAEGVAAIHGMRLYHGRLTPDAVLVAPNGSIKIISYVPWLIDKAPAADPVQHDTSSIGWLIYAMLGLGWPGTPMCGIPHVTVSGSEISWPKHLDGQLSPQFVKLLNAVILQPQIVPNALAVANQLKTILGPVDGTPQLASILANFENQPMAPAPAMTIESPESEDTGILAGSPFTDTTAFSPVPPPPAAALAARQQAVTTHSNFDSTIAEPTTEPGYANPAITKTEENPISGTQTSIEPRRWGMLILLTIFFGSLLINIVAVGMADNRPAAPIWQPVKIAKITDFDPKQDGGSGAENPKELGNITDGNKASCWNTETYTKAAKFNDTKPGVGVVVDLGASHALHEISLTVPAPGVSMELRLPNNPQVQDGKAEPNFSTVKEWQTITAASDKDKVITFKIDRPIDSRYLLLYFTKIPTVKGGWASGICSLEVK